MLVEPVLADHRLHRGGPSIVLLNGMGGTPLIELYLMYGEVATLLEKAGVAGRPDAWSATTSPRSTWPAPR